MFVHRLVQKVGKSNSESYQYVAAKEQTLCFCWCYAALTSYSVITSAVQTRLISCICAAQKQTWNDHFKATKSQLKCDNAVPSLKIVPKRAGRPILQDNPT